ncbi:MAG TPA: HEAT repeat domain-containing protein [Thermoanaerobaculia bacterium]|nr:HEAT repeat domain-containing protein [Thermoanaerobaculia bacterium]
MDCRDLTTLGIERLTGEASEASRRELDAHVDACESCRRDLERLEELWTTLGRDPEPEVTPEFRRRTLGLLEEEMIRGRVKAFRPTPTFRRPLLQAAALVAAAGVGYLLARGLPGRDSASPAASPSWPVAAVTPTAPGAAGVPGLAGNPRLANVSYRPADKDGRVAIGFDVTTRREVEGKPNDPEVAKLLAYLVAHNSESAGEKSRAIEVVSEHYGTNAAPASPEIVAALTSTLRADGNPGVRKKAADTLASFQSTPEIRAAFLQALKSDKNPAVRLAAIDALAAAARQSPDASTIESLKEKAVDPQENGFVRAKAASALKAMSF